VVEESVRGAAHGLTANEIYDLFEFDTAPAVRDAIIEMSAESDPEPVRSALNILGQRHGVQALTDY
jgi:hypothetical protein